MTIKDAHKLNKGDKIRVILNDITIDTEVDSTSISEVGVTIWFYDWDGTYHSTSSENVTYTGPEVLTKEEKFIQFLEERIATSNLVAAAAYIIVKNQFKKLFYE